jgi:putative acetyltransferase
MMSNSNIEIRSERVGDEDSIDLVNCTAFGKMDEAHIPRLLRQYYPCFDRQYSITAWDRNRMVGHALFSPARIRFMDETIVALAVAPVAVIPEYQKRGIGEMMMNYGHEMGCRDGFLLAFLCGHPEYYPRMKYIPCFGFAKIIIESDKLPGPSHMLTPYPVRESDIPWLVNRFEIECADIDFSWLRGNSISEWVLPSTSAMVWRDKDGRRAGYTLSKPSTNHLNLLLADDADLAREIIFTIKPQTIEHHECGWLYQNAIDKSWGKAEVKLSKAAMACELQDGVLKPLLDALESKQRLPGFCNWPITFVLL